MGYYYDDEPTFMDKVKKFFSPKNIILIEGSILGCLLAIYCAKTIFYLVAGIFWLLFH